MKYGIIIGDLTKEAAIQLLSNLETTSSINASVVTEADDEPGIDDGALLDATNLPWDERIHANSKTKNKDGRWKARKGVQPTIVADVELELRSRVPSAPAAPQAAPAAPVPVQPVPVAPVAPVPVAPAPTPAPMPVAPVAPVAPARDYQGLLIRIAALFRENLVPQNYTDTIVQRINTGFHISTVSTLTDISGNPQMVEYAWQCLEVDGKAA